MPDADDDDSDDRDDNEMWDRIRDCSPAERADALDQLAGRFLWTDRHLEAAAAFEAAGELHAADDHHLRAGTSLHNAAVALDIDGRPVDALATHERAVTEFRAGWADGEAAECDGHVAVLLRAAGRFREAETRLDDALRDLTAAGRRSKTTRLAMTRADWFIAEGRFRDAVRLLRGARAVLREDQTIAGVAAADERLADCYLHLGRFDDALASARSARAVYEALGDEDGVACLDSRRAEIMAAAGEPHEALALLATVRGREQASGRAPLVAWCDLRSARILVGLDNPGAACPLLESAAAVFDAAGADQWAAVARIDWASALLASGDSGDRAARVLRRARTPLRKAGMTWEARRCAQVQAAIRTQAPAPGRTAIRRHDAVA